MRIIDADELIEKLETIKNGVSSKSTILLENIIRIVSGMTTQGINTQEYEFGYEKGYRESKCEETLNYPNWCGEDTRCDEVGEDGCPYLNEDESHVPPCKRKTILGTTIEDLREELSRGCEYSATQEVVHQNFYEAMEELGGTGDWDEMAAEDLEGQMCVLQSLFETFYDKTVEKILNYIGSYEEEEQ